MIRMLRTRVRAALAAFVLAAAGHAAAGEDDVHSLGGYPLCEASAAVVVKCPHKENKQCILVADNELDDRLFVYEIKEDGDKLRLKNRREIYFTAGHEIEDIEALVALSDGDVAIFGSHSRKKSCKPDRKRHRSARATLHSTYAVLSSVQFADGHEHDCDTLFGPERDAVMDRVCDAIEKAENAAERASEVEDDDDRKEACEDAAPFNLEGAVRVASAQDGRRIWVGLRAPLIDGRAVMLRQADADKSFSFDAVALVDLAGFGIRELAIAGTSIWIIAGPDTDEERRHVLRHFQVDLLRHGEVIETVRGKKLPERAEGLALDPDGEWAVIFMDGDEAKKPHRMTCRTESTYVVRQLR